MTTEDKKDFVFPDSCKEYFDNILKMTVSIPIIPPPNRGRNPPYQYPNQFGAPFAVPIPNKSS